MPHGRVLFDKTIVARLERTVQSTVDGAAAGYMGHIGIMLLACMGLCGGLSRDWGDHTVSAMTNDGRKPQTKRSVLCKTRPIYGTQAGKGKVGYIDSVLTPQSLDTPGSISACQCGL
jgi:hypothetical protein